MTIENKLGITNSAELAKEEERLSKMQAIKLFESDALANLPAGKFSTLAFIHEYLFHDIYSFAGEIRDVNIAHPFREGNGRSMRIWLDDMLKKELGQCIDWSIVDKEDYLLAMERSPIRDIEIKHVLGKALTNNIDDRLTYMKGLDVSYHIEGYNAYKAEEL